MKNLIIKSFSLIDKEKIISPKGTVERALPLCQIMRDEVYSEKHLTFGKLAFADKLAFSAAAIAIEATKIENPKDCAIVLLTNIGSLHRDKEFMETIKQNSPSPQFFSATLPSSPIAEISIVFGLKGANKVIFADDELARKTAELMLKECDELLFVEINIGQNTEEIENSFARAWVYAVKNIILPE
jgi:hypothetical protein